MKRSNLFVLIAIVILVLGMVACNDGPTIVDTADSVRDGVSLTDDLYTAGEQFQNDAQNVLNGIDSAACQAGVNQVGC